MCRSEFPRKLMVGKLYIALLVALVSLNVSAWLAFSWSHRPQEEVTYNVSNCRVALAGFPADARWGFAIDDPEAVERLVAAPIRNAVLNPEPMRWVSLGDILLTKKDGSTTLVRLFLPLGHIRIGDHYYDADFTELRKDILNTLDIYAPSLRPK